MESDACIAGHRQEHPQCGHVSARDVLEVAKSRDYPKTPEGHTHTRTRTQKCKRTHIRTPTASWRRALQGDRHWMWVDPEQRGLVHTSLPVCPRTATSRKPCRSWDPSPQLFCPITEDGASALRTHGHGRGVLVRSWLPELVSAMWRTVKPCDGHPMPRARACPPHGSSRGHCSVNLLKRPRLGI